MSINITYMARSAHFQISLPAVDIIPKFYDSDSKFEFVHRHGQWFDPGPSAATVESLLTTEQSTATITADKYNEGARVYDRMDGILENINYVVDIDIRDLSLHELSLAHNRSWLVRRSTLSKKKMRKKANRRGQPGLLDNVDWGDVQNSVNFLKSQNWFLTVQQDPDVVSTVMHHVSDRLVYKSITG